MALAVFKMSQLTGVVDDGLAGHVVSCDVTWTMPVAGD